ncbi:MAG: hypothetical protein ACYS21_15740 [Planctomycetota bacterium]|jgi:hypothetical protein
MKRKRELRTIVLGVSVAAGAFFAYVGAQVAWVAHGYEASLGPGKRPGIYITELDLFIDLLAAKVAALYILYIAAGAAAGFCAVWLVYLLIERLIVRLIKDESKDKQE